MTGREETGGGIALFVRRPILAFVLNALIVIAGLAGLLGVEIRELPDVDRPVVTITTEFTGASPQTIDREVTAEIEAAAGRVAGVSAISSDSRFGRSRVTVEFDDSIDLDVAATDVRDAISRVRNALPDDAEEPRIVKADADADPVMRIGVTSATRSVQDLTDLVEEAVVDRLISVPGVADAQVYGARTPVFRVDLDLTALASRGLTLADIRSALDTVSFDAPAGALTMLDQSLSVRATAAVATPEGFEAIPLRDGLRLGDVAVVSLGPDIGESILRSNGRTGVGIGILRQAQSNTIEISSAVRNAVDELGRVLPEDVAIFVSSDEATFVRGAINEVIITLILATLIVIAIIYVFLRDARATMIPALTIPVALIGTLAAIYLTGFSLNILTLLALVLATGMVVDDAIVVLENIVRRRAEGMGPRAAAVLGTRQVFFAVVSTTATLAAVFVPISFLPGQAGGLFREFGFTLAFAVTLSSFVALSICPVLAARLLRPIDPDARPSLMARVGIALERIFARTLNSALDAPAVVIAATLLIAATAALMFGSIRSELTPQEDRSVALMSVEAPQGASLDYTNARMREIEARLEPFVASGEVTNVFMIAGSGGRDNRGFMVMTLAPWEKRARSQAEIAEDINTRVRGIIGIDAIARQPNSLGIRGAGRGLQFALLGNSYERLAESADELIARMEQDPRFGDVRLGFEQTQPQLFVEVDRDRAADLGIAIDGLGESIQAVLDGRTVTQVFVDDESYDVKMFATAQPVNDPTDLENIFMQTGSGQMVPLSTIVSIEERPIAPNLGREQQMRAVSVTASLDGSFAIGDAYAEVQRLTEAVIGPAQRIIPLAEAAALDETERGLLVTFGFAILVVFLVLSAQFESFVSAVIVMATVPLGLACAVFALLITGMSLNVYSQIGLLLVVGIIAKNGILIVEFANQLRDRGASVREAAEEAAVVRLRPVMMTMTSTVLGGVPLVLASGAGAEAREALGWVIVGGLGLATLITLYLTPVAYLALAGLSKPRMHETERLAEELRTAEHPAAELHAARPAE